MNERQALEDAFRAVFPHPKSKDHPREVCEEADLRAYRFWRMLDAGAYLDAAMMLVPEGWDFALDNFDGELGQPSAWVCSRIGPVIDGCGPTPSAALLSAIMKARNDLVGSSNIENVGRLGVDHP